MSRKGPLQKNEETDKPLRIAIVEKDRCKPKNCGLLCKRSCPVVKMGEQWFFLSKSLCSKAKVVLSWLIVLIGYTCILLSVGLKSLYHF